MKNISVLRGVLIVFLNIQIIHAQNVELGLHMGCNALRPHSNQYNNTFSGPLPGVGLSLRYQQPSGIPSFRHMTATLEWYRSAFYAVEQMSPGGAGGEHVDYSCNALQISFTDYLLNWNLFRKKGQLSLGFFAGYKALYQTRGLYTRQVFGSAVVNNHITFWWDEYNISGRNNGTLNRLQYGICAGIGFKTFHMLGQTFRCRIDYAAGVRSENRFGFAAFRPASLKFSLCMNLNKAMLSKKVSSTPLPYIPTM